MENEEYQRGYEAGTAYANEVNLRIEALRLALGSLQERKASEVVAYAETLLAFISPVSDPERPQE